MLKRLELKQCVILWTGAGLEAVETREITVQRTFSNFEEFWGDHCLGAPSIRPTLAAMSPADVELFKTRVRARLPSDAGDVLLTHHAPTR